ncbi:hypothetical protein DVR12_07325 [Chitinophaga silvatica]|uniref:Uncharacterized protein n=1 Tax=Chitinophaga silvatica TaxID=2282649 RepID=A0A3E1YEN8_9BACT|nr:hypothetical protein [Chitinophaga silvatica]RFS24988.1 hypothetical protein DVR12_07325 [Chitinophaga silvatica]
MILSGKDCADIGFADLYLSMMTHQQHRNLETLLKIQRKRIKESPEYCLELMEALGFKEQLPQMREAYEQEKKEKEEQRKVQRKIKRLKAKGIEICSCCGQRIVVNPLLDVSEKKKVKRTSVNVEKSELIKKKKKRDY